MVILVFMAIGCSDQYGGTPFEPDSGTVSRDFLTLAGDQNKAAETLIDEGGDLQDNLTIVSNSVENAELDSITEETTTIINNLLDLSTTQEESRTEMVSQVNQNYHNFLDLLGIFIVELPGHLENIGQRPIQRIEVKVPERRMYFHSSNNDTGDIILGSAPVYFGYDAINNIDGKKLPETTVSIEKLLDAGEGNQFIDKNGYSFGRYYIELSNSPGVIISANTKDETINTSVGSIAVLRATSGPLRMSSHDLITLVKHLQKFEKANININFTYE